MLIKTQSKFFGQIDRHIFDNQEEFCSISKALKSFNRDFPADVVTEIVIYTNRVFEGDIELEKINLVGRIKRYLEGYIEQEKTGGIFLMDLVYTQLYPTDEEKELAKKLLKAVDTTDYKKAIKSTTKKEGEV